MKRLQSLMLIALAAAVLPGSGSAGGIPCPEFSNVPNCIPVSPDGGLSYAVRIVFGNAGDCQVPVPAESVLVEVRFHPVASGMLCWCDPGPGAGGFSLFATTDANGDATFNIAAGGCAELGHPSLPQGFIAEVFANGVKMQECGSVSPDAVDSGGRLPTDTAPAWDPAGTCASGLADAVVFTNPLATAVYDWCADINCDGAVGLADATLLTPYLSGAISCAGDTQ